MKVVHFSTYDMAGGAARATYRLHKALINLGIQADMAVLNRSIDDPTVVQVPTSIPQRLLAKVGLSLDALPLSFYKNYRGETWSPAFVRTFPYSRIDEICGQADVLTLFWVCQGFLSVNAIGHLLKMKKPLVWRLSDMWPFTGGCHHSESCIRYEDKCGRCPQLGGLHDHDLSRWVWKRKHRSWDGSPLTIVAPSRWIADCARRSSLFRDKRVVTIPTGVDIGIFKPINKALARSLLNLPSDVPFVLFGAVAALEEPRKGGAYLIKALEILTGRMNTSALPHLVIFGSYRKPEINNWRSQIHVMGYVRDDIMLSLLYAACDVFVAPSTVDNLPNTVIEALACGTPCVAFNLGGMPDLIEHEKNGYLARPFDTDDLARGIEWVLEDDERRKALSHRARAKVEDEFALEKAARRYADLYKEILEKG